MIEITKEELENLYLVQNKSSGEIAKIIGCGKTWAGKLLRKYGLTDKKSLEDRKKSKFDKITKTNRERYGGKSPFNSSEVQQRAQESLKKKYDITNPAQIRLSHRTRQIMSSQNELETYLRGFDHTPTLYELVEDLDISHCQLNKKIRSYNLEHMVNYYPVTSKTETDLSNWLKQNDPTLDLCKDRTLLEGQEIDIYIPSKQIGIEINGNYWHSIDMKGLGYHQKKSQLALEKGIFLYHIFEYEWDTRREQILSQLKNLLGLNSRRIGARQCELRKVEPKEARAFLEENHLQGADRASIRGGLYYQEELVAIMTFGKPRFNKKYEYELLRFCCKSDTTVHGAASKLFKHFTTSHPNKSIISYSDIAHAKGQIYEKLGFELKQISRPNYVWCKGRKILTRYQCQRFKLIEMFPEENFTNMSETAIMTSLGYQKIEDCGNLVYSYHE